jgi:hypothetical protein
MSGLKLLVSDSHGVYVPQVFTEQFDPVKWGMPEDDADWLVCMAGPVKTEWYWESWDWIMTRAIRKDADGNVWRLWQDGDLFAYCEALMTDEEYKGFYGEPRRELDLDNNEQAAWYDTSAELR